MPDSKVRMRFSAQWGTFATVCLGVFTLMHAAGSETEGFISGRQ